MITTSRHPDVTSKGESLSSGQSHPPLSRQITIEVVYVTDLPTTHANMLTLARLIFILFCHTDPKPRPSGRHTVEDSLREEFDVDTKRQRLTGIITFGYVMIVSSKLQAVIERRWRGAIHPSSRPRSTSGDLSRPS